MRDDDVADVLADEPESFDLAHGGFVAVHRGTEDETRRADPGGVIAIVRAVAGVDEDQTVVGLHEQHVADDRRCPEWAHRPAVEVMDLHSSPVPTRASSSPRPIWVTRLAESK